MLILWLLIALATILIAFLLTIQSMRYFREKPSNLNLAYSLYLVQRLDNLTQDVLNALLNTKDAVIISFERLSKGNRQALVMYAPVNIVMPYKDQLGLIELEDYTEKLAPFLGGWEIGQRPNSIKNQYSNLQLIIQELKDTEQLWWQVVVETTKKTNLEITLRVITQGDDPQHLAGLNHTVLQSLESVGLSFLPQSYSAAQLLKFYRQRSLGGSLLNRSYNIIKLDPGDLLKLINP